MNTAPTPHQVALRLTAAGRDPHLIATYLQLEAEAAKPPQYPDGLYQFTPKKQPSSMAIFKRRYAQEWRNADGERGYAPDLDVFDVTLLRVLGDDEIAVKRVRGFDDVDIVRSYAEHIAECSPNGHYSAVKLISHYADGLDAESGDR